MKANWIALTVLACSAAGFAQAPDTLWTRTYGGTANDEAMSIQQTSDGGYIAAGYTFSFASDGSVDGYLVRLNSLGDTLWTRTFANGGDEAFYSIKQTSDGGFIMAGFSNTGSADFYLVKADSQGFLEWSRTYGGSMQDDGFCVLTALDGGYLIAGSTQSYGSGNFDFYFVRTNFEGDTLWTSVVGSDANERLFSAGYLVDGGFFAAGWRFQESVPPDGNWDMYLVKIDSEGDTLWTRTYIGTGPPQQQVAEAAIQTPDGGFLLAGWEDTGYNQPYIVKADSLGHFQWSQVYPLQDLGGQFNSITPLVGGGYVLAGMNAVTTSDYQALLLRIDDDGNYIWNQTYGGGAIDRAISITGDEQTGFILAGFTHSFGSGGSDFYIVKTAEEPISLCDSLSGVLFSMNSPYYVTCDLVVPAGDTLIIEPGVTLDFAGPYSLTVEGTLIAEGTVTDSIVFTTDTLANPGRWRGIRFPDSTSTASILSYCLIENGSAVGEWPESRGGAVSCMFGTSPTFEHCTIANNTAVEAGGIYCYDHCSPTFSGCDIISNSTSDGHGGGAMCYINSSPIFLECTVRNNTANGGHGGGMYTGNYCSPTFTNCILKENSSSEWKGGGIFAIEHSTPLLQNCVIADNSADSGGGIACVEYSVPELSNTIIAYSTGSGVYVEEHSGIQLAYSCLFDNEEGNFSGSVPSGLGVITTSNHNGDPCDQYFNIFLDPEFVGAATGDYHLTEASPCIDAGDPALYDPDCTISDIGAFYFYHLAKPESLIVWRDGNHMRLRWTVVDSTDCAMPSPIRSYVIYYEEELNENWDFLAVTTDTAYVHAHVIPFSPESHFYEVIATDYDPEQVLRFVESLGGDATKQLLLSLMR